MWPCVHPATGWPLLVFSGSFLRGARQALYLNDLPERVIKPCVCDNHNNLRAKGVKGVFTAAYGCRYCLIAFCRHLFLIWTGFSWFPATSGDRRKGEQPFYVKDYAERAAPWHVQRLLPSRSAPTDVVQAAAAQRSHLLKARGNGGPLPVAGTTGRAHASVLLGLHLIVFRDGIFFPCSGKSSNLAHSGKRREVVAAVVYSEIDGYGRGELPDPVIR
ncbi:hypothetical protein NDU88_007818 [Pleurodeles waltl]|uniref:Uncharacterized protein n=1 Tax=Pleurodeles waltl TaxID=8319 RepID=A0AAV7QMY1_PLEWA|nr:hypothetical protein NDU88_007818 [Pleurodeles waltl]